MRVYIETSVISQPNRLYIITFRLLKDPLFYGCLERVRGFRWEIHWSKDQSNNILSARAVIGTIPFCSSVDITIIFLAGRHDVTTLNSSVQGRIFHYKICRAGALRSMSIISLTDKQLPDFVHKVQINSRTIAAIAWIAARTLCRYQRKHLYFYIKTSLILISPERLLSKKGAIAPNVIPTAKIKCHYRTLTGFKLVSLRYG